MTNKMYELIKDIKSESELIGTCWIDNKYLIELIDSLMDLAEKEIHSDEK